MTLHADLKAQLAEAQAMPLWTQKQQLHNMPESRLAAMQQQHTVDMIKAIAEYVRHQAQAGACQDASPEDSLAAMQQQHTVKLVREVTQYLQKDMQHMQQMAKSITAGTPLHEGHYSLCHARG